MRKVIVLFTAILFVASVKPTFAADGAQLFKSKCAGCHGANGEGKPAMKAPALKGTTLDAAKLSELLTKGDSTRKAPHTKAISGLSDEQAKAITEHIKTLR